MKIVTIVGARPQFVKAAVVSRAFQKQINLEEIIIHTGQHYDQNMSDIFFEEMRIPKPKYNLGISGKTHGAMTGEMLKGIEEILLIEKPNWVLVYGDTNSTLAGSLAASKLHIPVAHIEAGLRSFNLKMPEEINRILTDRISKILFCPTDTAVNNLKNEGFEHFQSKIINVGDVMYDAAKFYEQFATKCNYDTPFVLATIHRQENTDDLNRLKSILSAFKEIGQTHKVVLPIHPRTKKIIESNSLSSCGIDLIEPVGYFEMISLLKNCSLVATDSGGLQKEAFFFKKPCLTLRDETEWVELVNGGFNMITSYHSEKIINSAKEMLNKKIDYSPNLYGNSNAGELIAKYLLKASL